MTIGDIAVRRAALAILASILFTACTTSLEHSGSSASGSGGTGGANICTTATDCPGADTACLTRTCNAGTCGVALAPMGSLAGTQTSGDCKAVVCNSAGMIITVADDSDVPSDSNACTQDICANGVPSHAPMPAGTACGATGQLTCDGHGVCAGCSADPDCGPPTACSLATCDLGTGLCSPNYVPSGQGDPGGQTDGDCKKLVCNGSGGTQSIDDDTDVPSDGNACTADACAGGVASHTLLPLGTSCGTGLVCDAVGACVGCIADADCGTNNACATYHCQAGTCTIENTPSGMGDPGGQVAGDCKKVVCNGVGGTTTVADDTDVQDDGNPCTNDTCSGGAAVHLPVGSGTSCGAGICYNGVCAYGCYVGGQLYPAQSYYIDSQICLSCDPSVSTTSLYTGSCHFNLHAGTCSGGGVCEMLYTECATGCSDCTVKPCGSGYCYGLPMPFGAPCVDDGNPCTTDQCNDFGGCIHVAVINGTGCGSGLVCVSGGCIDESTWDCGSGYTCQPTEHCCSGAAGNHGCRDMQTACP